MNKARGSGQLVKFANAFIGINLRRLVYIKLSFMTTECLLQTQYNSSLTISSVTGYQSTPKFTDT